MIRLPGDQNFWPARPLPSPMLPRAAQGYGQEEMLPQPRDWPKKMADCRHQYGAIAALQHFYTVYILAFICLKSFA